MQETLRYIGATLALVALVLWWASAAYQWRMFNPRAKRVAVAIGALLCGICYGFLEAAHDGVPFGPRVAVMCLLLVALVLALAYKFRDD